MAVYSGIIVSQPGNSTNLVIEILDVVKAFSNVFYVYVAVILSLITVILSHQNHRKGSLTRNLPSYSKRIQINFWQVYCLIVDQVSFCSQVHSKRVLWISFTFAAFAVIHGFMMNLISTDLIAEVSPPRINTIDDLHTPYFESVGIDIRAESQEYAALRSAPLNSTLNKLFRNKIEPSHNSTKPKSKDKREELELLSDGKEVLMLNIEQWSNVNKIIICCYNSHKNINLFVSKPFFSSTLHSLSSNLLDPELRAYLEQRVMVAFEFDVFIPALKNFAVQLFNEIGFEYNWNAMRCDKNLIDSLERNLPLLSITKLHSTLRLCCYATITAFTILVIEKLMRLNSRHLKPKFHPSKSRRVRLKSRQAWV